MNIVITGSTRGIGLGLAREFLVRGHRVFISSRHQEAVQQTLAGLVEDFPATDIAGQVCDVTRESDVKALWDAAVHAFGVVDIWINNAGCNNAKQLIHEMTIDDIESTLRTNLVGTVSGSVIAYRGMQAQGSGWIYNMEGFGSDGMIGIYQIPYGLSKYGLRYFTKALAKTARDTPVRVGYLSPGIVTTEMAVPRKELRGAFFYEKMKLLNVLSDHVETVTPWLVDQMLASNAGGKNGMAIRWMTLPRVLGRFISSLFRKRRVIEEAMERRDRMTP